MAFDFDGWLRAKHEEHLILLGVARGKLDLIEDISRLLIEAAKNEKALDTVDKRSKKRNRSKREVGVRSANNDVVGPK